MSLTLFSLVHLGVTRNLVLLSLPGIAVRFFVATAAFLIENSTCLKNIKKQDIVCLQETKGNMSLIHKHFRKLSRTFWILANLSVRSVDEAGLIILVSKSSCPREESITHIKMIPGRVSRVLIQGDVSRQIVYNIHNQEFTSENMDTVCKSILNDLSDCSTDTLRNNLIARGDINIPSVRWIGSSSQIQWDFWTSGQVVQGPTLGGGGAIGSNPV